MGRHLLSEASTIKVYSTIGVFANGDNMSVNIYKDGSSTAETLTTGTLTQIGTTGVYYWEFSDLATAPTSLSEYYWIMQDDTVKVQSGVERFGGWVETVEPLGEADTCKITIDLYSGDGECTVSVEDLFDPNKKNYMELPEGTAVYSASRYFKLGQYKPSYNRLTGQAYWVFPQGAIINVKLASFGIESNTVTVPAQSTIDLYTLLNP